MSLSTDDRYDIMLKAAYLYYVDDRTQSEISALLNISRPTIIKLLNQAKEDGIVKIEVVDIRKSNRYIKMESELRGILNVDDVKIVEAKEDEFSEIANVIGAEAASYLSNMAKSNMRIGIGWGKTLESLSYTMKPNRGKKGIDFLPLLGCPGSGANMGYTMFSNNTCERIAMNFEESSMNYLFAPLVAQNETIAKTFLKSDNVKMVKDKMDKLDIAMVGLDGGIAYSTTIEYEKFDKSDIEELRRARMVGNICCRFYDVEGTLCDIPLNRRVISISAEQIKKTPLVIAAAGGKHKIESIVGAARGGLFNVLITDQITAQRLIDYYKKD